MRDSLRGTIAFRDAFAPLAHLILNVFGVAVVQRLGVIGCADVDVLGPLDAGLGVDVEQRVQVSRTGNARPDSGKCSTVRKV